MGGEGSGGYRKGAGKKRSRLVLECGMKLSLSRVNNDGEEISPAVDAEVIHIGGEDGHARQFVVVTDDETLTFFVNDR